MFEVETYETILSRMLAKFPDTYDKRQGSVLWDLLSPKAIELAQAYIQMDNVLNLGFAETTSGEYLERRVAEQGLERKPATYASGTITITAPDGTLIPLGTRISTDDTTPIYAETTEETTVLSGSTSVPARAEVAGASGNVLAGAFTTVVGDLAGVASVTNSEDFSGGVAEETDEELYQRYHEKVSRPATSGNKYHYEQWAKEIPGISDARCYPIWAGVGTVKVVVINSEKRSPSEAVLKQVTEHIDSVRPVLADVTVAGVTEVSIDINAKLTLRPGTELETARLSIMEQVERYFKTIAFESDIVRYTAIGNAILDATGVIDYADLQINGLNANIILSDVEVPVVGAIDVTLT